MIWIPKNRDEDRRSALIAHLAGSIAESSIEGLCSDPEQATELAAAIATFLEQQTGSEQGVDAGYLILLAMQAMTSVGDADAARRLMVFGSGLVRPAEWEVTGGGDVWTLDLRRMMLSDDVPMELLFFNTLGMIIDAVAEVWDATGGEGVLGLRHVYDSAVALLGESHSPQGLRSIAQEIQDTCRLRLDRAHRERGWQSVPAVMNLDI